MTNIEYFKLQAKNLFRDWKTKVPVKDDVVADLIIYEYSPKYFDVSSILFELEMDENDFSLMKAQHVIAYLSGFYNWHELIHASEEELELGKILLNLRDRFNVQEWLDYSDDIRLEYDAEFDGESKLKIFKEVWLPNI